MSVFRHLASRCLHEMRRSDDDYQDDLRLYSAEPRSPSVISTCRLNCAYISRQYSSVMWMTLHLSLLTGAFSPDGSMCGRNAGNGTIILRPGGKTKSHKKRNFVKNACRLLQLSSHGTYVRIRMYDTTLRYIALGISHGVYVICVCLVNIYSLF